MTFHDDFERALLGPDWADDGPIFEDEGLVRGDQFLADGAWQAEDSDNENPDIGMGSIRYVGDAGDDQYIEAEVGNFFQGHNPADPEYQQYVEGEIYLFAQLSPASNVGIGVGVIIDANTTGPDVGTGLAYMQIFTVDAAGARTFYDDGEMTPLVGWQSNPDYVIRMEVSAAGHVRAYFEGNLLAEDDVPPPGGDYAGVGMYWNLTDYTPGDPNPGESLRVNWVTIGRPVSGWRIGRVGWGSSPW